MLRIRWQGPLAGRRARGVGRDGDAQPAVQPARRLPREHVLPTLGVFGWTSSGIGANAGGGVRVPIGAGRAVRTDVGVSQGLPNRVPAFQGVTRAFGAR